MRRLTPTEYNNTLRDLMGYSVQDYKMNVPPPMVMEDDDDDLWYTVWPWHFPNEIEVHGFEGMAEGHVSSSYLIEQYQRAGVHFSALVLSSDAFWACEDRDEAACAGDSVARFANRAYRRPLSREESARVSAFFEANVSSFGVEDGTRMTIAGLLVSPQFLYRLEGVSGDGKPEKLDDFELASRLSYFLWDSMPDAELFAAASGGELSSKRGLQAQVERMMADPRARDAVVYFHRQWLDLDDVYAANADLETYMPKYLEDIDIPDDEDGVLFVEELEEQWSGFLIGVRAAMVREAELFVEKTVFDGGGDLYTLLTDNHGFVSTVSEAYEVGTEVFYNPTQVGSEAMASFHLSDSNLDYDISLYPAAFPPEQRSGVLTMGAVLAGKSHPVHPSSIHRGIFVLERLGCQVMGQPPDSAAGAAPPDTVDAESTNRARLEAITTPAECAVCHTSINPAGFAFENYDSLGGWRLEDNGQPVDASGSLSLGDEDLGSFSSAAELGQKLAQSEQVYDCYALNWTRYAIGREVDFTDPALKDIQKGFRRDGDVQQLIVDIATSDLFRYH